MLDESSINLTKAENERLMAYALEHGLTKEEAALRLASDRITDLFVVRHPRGQVVPMRALKR